MEIKKIVNKLGQNNEFKEWKKEHYASSLVHIFKMFDEVNKDEWQIGFFNPNETITSFVIGPESI